MRVSSCFMEESISHDVSFLLSVNNEDTLHGLVNAYSRCTLSARMGKLFISEEDTRYSRGYCELACCSGVACGFYMHSAASKAPTSLRKRPGFSRSVSFRFSFSSATSFSFFFRSTAPRIASQRQELSDFLGYEYAAGGCKRLGAMVLVMR